MKLNQLQPQAGSTKKRKRVARGIGSGKGKTAGRGVKGQTSRTGVSINGFEGGQMPIHRRLPKRGFTSLNRVEYTTVNLAVLEDFCKRGKLASGAKVNVQLLSDIGAVKSTKLPVKILAQGKLSQALHLEVDAVSASALEAIKKAGGSVTVKERKAA